MSNSNRSQNPDAKVAETIRRAIDKLTKLRDEAAYEITGDWLVEIDPKMAAALAEDPRQPVTNDPIMVTLYRTIDAQLHILGHGQAIFYTMFPAKFTPPELAEVAYPLALAILDEVDS